jgi:predicted transcriptional regulator
MNVRRPFLAAVPKHLKVELKPCHTTLGPLEAEVMQILWAAHECSVRQVVYRLPRKMAYTTVMTTMVRLFHKGLLSRRKQERKFIYAARFSSERWVRVAASEALARFLATPTASRGVLVSCLVEDLFRHDRDLLAAVNKRLNGNHARAADPWREAKAARPA